MQRNLAALATAAFLTLPQAARAADEEPAADQVVGAIEAAFGVNPGQRRNHI